jgi:hypothetical protein
MLQIEAIEKADAKLPSDAKEPIEANDPAEPIDSTEPAEPMDKIDPVEPIDRIDPAEPVLRIEPPALPGLDERTLSMIALCHRCQLRPRGQAEAVQGRPGGSS